MSPLSSVRNEPARMGAMRRSVAILLLLTTGVVVSGQQPAPRTPAPQPPTFRLETSLIEADVVVTDAQGNIVRGLTKDDFTILDDGKPQPVAAFTFVDIPLERADGPSAPGPTAAARPTASRVAPDVKTNERPFDGRVYILVLDDLHTTPEWSNQVKKTAQLFIERNLGDNDLMAVVYSSRGNVGSGFTNDRSVLLAALGEFTGLRATVPQLTGIVQPAPTPQSARGSAGAPPGVGAIIGPTVRLERENDAARMLTLIQKIANWAGETLPARRKALLLFSEGVEGFNAGDFAIAGDFGGEAGPETPEAQFRATALESRVGDQVKTTIDASTRANVSIYPIDSRGLDNVSITNGGLFLSAMANETGGMPVLRTNDFTKGFERVVRNSSSYYALAFMPPATNKAGTFHSIAVKVNRPGLRVRVRQGYATPAAAPRSAPVGQPVRADAASPELNAAINSPVPATDVRLAVFAVPFKGPGKNAKNVSVLIGAELGNLALGESGANGGRSGDVELTVIVTGLREVKGSRTDRVRFTLTPDTVERTGGALRVLHRLDLPPGKYQVRVVARDSSSGHLGSVMNDLDVPELNTEKTRLTMSGVILTSVRASDLPTTGDDERLTPLLGAPPSAQREFSGDDELVVFVEVYDRDLAWGDDVLTTQVINAAGRAVLESAEPLSSGASQDDRGASGYQTHLRLDDLLPGRYLLKMEARSKTTGDVAVSRSVPFVVR